MKIKNVEKALIKIGASKSMNNPYVLMYQLGTATIEIHSNHDSDECLFAVVQSKSDRDNEDLISDYHTGVYCYTIKRAIQWALDKSKLKGIT